MNKKTISKTAKKKNTTELVPALGGEQPVDALIPKTIGLTDIEIPSDLPTLQDLFHHIENRELDCDELLVFDLGITDNGIMTGPDEGVMYCRIVRERAYFVTLAKHKQLMHFAGDARMYVIWLNNEYMPIWHLAMWLPLYAPDTFMLDACFENLRDEVFIPTIEYLADKHAEDTTRRANEWQQRNR